MSQALKKTEGTEVAVQDDILDMIASDAGAGKENMTAEDFLIPRIGIIQSLSPQRNKAKAEFIDGCSEGQIFEGTSKKLWDGGEGIEVVPIKFNRCYLEWKPDRGGLAKNHGDDRTAYDSARVDEKGKHFTPEGNSINLSAEYFVFVLRKGLPPLRAVISMSSTSLKQAKAWNNLMAETKHPDGKGGFVETPAFYNVYNMKTVPVTKKDNTWFAWNISVKQTVFKEAEAVTGVPNDKSLYNLAKDFLSGINAGKVKAAPVVSEAHSEDEPNDADPM